MDRLDKTYGKGTVMKLGDRQVVQVDAIPTGSLSLDIALGVNGFAKGRIVEVYGPESSGKTTLTIHAIAECQKQGGIAAFIDAEHAFDAGYARKLGVDIDNLLISQPDLGQTLLISMVWLALIFVSGINIYLFFIFFIIVSLTAFYLIFFVSKFEYIKMRFLSFVSSSEAGNYQAEKASDAIISGGFKAIAKAMATR